MRLQQTFGANDEIDNTMVNIPDETLSIVPVDIRRRFNVDTTSCVYWDSPKLAMGQPRGRQKTNQLYTLDPVLTCCLYCWIWKRITARKVSKYGVFSGPYFPVFGLNTEIYEVYIHIYAYCILHMHITYNLYSISGQQLFTILWAESTPDQITIVKDQNAQIAVSAVNDSYCL